jgi:macrophage erythroblast attacher
LKTGGPETPKVPYENHRRIFRTAQKNIERDLNAVQNAASDLATREVDRTAAMKSVEAMIAKVEGLKQKVCWTFLLRVEG